MSSFPVIFMYLYPDKVATINSWSETALGVGYSVGPALGGFLYDAGGFHLPFVAMGVANILFAIIIILALPSKEFNTCITTKEGNRDNYTPIMTIVKEVLVNLKKFSFNFISIFLPLAESKNDHILC